jgi:hypothetical protein
MDSPRFDALTQVLASGRTRRHTLTLLGGLLAARQVATQPILARRKRKKITICLNGQTIKVLRKKRDTFLLAGATLGECSISPPPGPPPPPASPTCESTGCPYTEVCQAGACVNCINAPCTVDSDCCTNLCAGVNPNKRCRCQFGIGICSSNAQCCNGRCNGAQGTCGCDPAGAPCASGDGSSCCSGTCIESRCQ